MRVVLTVENGALAGSSFTLAEGALALGRDEKCAIRFADADATRVSRRHASVSSADGGFRIADERSTNGTFVNGERVQQRLLADGDLVELGNGGPRMRVRLDDRPADVQLTSAVLPRRSLAERALYDPAKDNGRRHGAGTILAMTMMIGAGAFMGLLMALMVFFSLGPGAALVGLFVAFTPAPVYLTLWLWLDRYDPEPAWALAACLLWGAGAATFAAGLLNTAAEMAVFSLSEDAIFAGFVGASFVAPLVEESAKGLAVVIIYLALRKEFDGVLDGIVYAGVVALGFATVENVLYYGRMMTKEGASGVVVLFFIRGVLAPFTHSVFTAMIGIGVGLARQSHNAAVKVIAPIAGWCAAVFLHFLWNTIAGLSGSLFGFLVMYVLVWVPLLFGFFVTVIWLGHRESRLIARMLARDVERGTLDAAHVRIVASWPRRVAWLFGSLSDLRRFSARRDFLHAATRLALSYWHVDRAAAAGGLTVSLGQVPRFVNDLQRLRALV